jgi:hypothetical protein
MQGPLWLAAGTKSMECQVGFHAPEDGFEQSPHEAVVYRRGNGGNVLLVGVYVDDLVITGTKDAEVAGFKEE